MPPNKIFNRWHVMQEITRYIETLMPNQQGLVLRSSHQGCADQVPIALLPSPFPQHLYRQCVELQPIVHDLIRGVANDYNFLENSLSSVLTADEFTRNLFDIYTKITKEGIAQPVGSCVIRSDYMVHRQGDVGFNEFQARQVEINTMSSAMAGHSLNAKQMHNFLLKKYRIRAISGAELPNPSDNEALDVVARSLMDAYNAYCKDDCFILFVIDEKCKNFSDIYWAELAIHKLRPDIRVVRKKFSELPKDAKLGPNKELFVDGTKEVALVYFRCGYDPSQYNFEGAWKTRLILEQSRAIKSSPVNYQLAGAKKFQQILSTQEELEKFISSQDAEKLIKVICKFWPLDAGTAAGEEGLSLALNSPDNLVLKPQREGGGHNIFGSDIKTFLEQTTDPSVRSQYILMELINSPREQNWLLSNDSNDELAKFATPEKVISELGVYGGFVAQPGYFTHQSHGPYLIRTKGSDVKEGGVSAGFAGISSVAWVNDAFDLSSFYDL